MQKGSNFSDPRRRVLFFASVAALVFVTGFKISPNPAQDVIRLETRLNQLEQRLYTIESSVRNIDQQARIAGATRGGGASADELALLRSQLQTIQLRLIESECALAKLDERTLSPALRDARRKSGGASDPCRANGEAPLRLPERRE